MRPVIPLRRKKWLIYLIHGFTWASIFILTIYFYMSGNKTDIQALYHNFRNIVLYAFIFYINYLVFIPLLYFRNRKLLYYSAALLLILLATSAIYFSFSKRPPIPRQGPAFNQVQPAIPDLRANHQQPAPLIPKGSKPPMNLPLYNFFITSLLVTGISLGVRFSDRYNEQEKQRKEAEREQLNTELAFLKNQINPHFFFNTLNNIYSLVQTNVYDGQKAILQLSKLMRYLLYETDKGSVPISKEIEFMKVYFDLMKLRLTPKIDLQISLPDSYPDIKISPLIFLPFIENAFKHGISNRTFSFIHVELRVSVDEITFQCDNSLTEGNGSHFDNGSGIGLENVRKRLSLLYARAHQLKIESDKDAFHVKLVIFPESLAT